MIFRDRTSGRRRLLGALALGLFCIYLVTATLPKHHLQNVDPLSALIPAWSLGQRGTLDIPEYENATPWIQKHDAGVLSDRMPGIILWAAPFYALLGTPDGPSVGVAGLAAATATTAAVVVLYRVFRRLASPLEALVGCGLLALGTATWTVSASALWPHGLNQLWLAVGMLLLSKQRWFLTGLAHAAAIVTRPHLALVAAVCGVWESIHRRSLRPTVRLGVGSSLGLVGLLLYNHLVFHQTTLLVGVYADRPTTAAGHLQSGSEAAWAPFLFVGTQAAGTLVSPLRGLFVMSPFLILLLPGLVAAWRKAPTWVRASAVSGCVYLVVQLLGNGFAGGSFFYSYRLSLEPLTLWSPLLIMSAREWVGQRTWRKVTFSALAVVSVLQHAIGALFFMDTLDFTVREWRRSQVAEGLLQMSSAELMLLAATGLALSGVAGFLIAPTSPRGRRLRRGRPTSTSTGTAPRQRLRPLPPPARGES